MSQYSVFEKRLMLLGLLGMPIFAIVNPLSFYIAFIHCFEETETQSVYVPNFWTFYSMAVGIFALITVLKYPLFRIKRRFAEKEPSIFLYLLFHAASQLPYLILLGVIVNYWGARDLNELGFGMFLWYFTVAVATWIASFCIFNFLTYLYRD